MSHINTEETIGHLVVDHPARSRVFEKYGIDYCCGGGVSLAEACRRSAVDVGEVVAELVSSDTDRAESSIDFSALALTDLIDHILETHHAFLRTELPRLGGMVKKVAGAHGDSPGGPQLRELITVFENLSGELLSHMMKEERMLFPAIKSMEATGTPGGPFGSVANPIRVMEAEHDSAGRALERIRELTDTYTLPEWGCNTYRAMLDGLRELELDLHQHIHKENNILFPKATALEKSLSSATN